MTDHTPEQTDGQAENPTAHATVTCTLIDDIASKGEARMVHVECGRDLIQAAEILARAQVSIMGKIQELRWQAEQEAANKPRLHIARTLPGRN